MVSAGETVCVTVIPRRFVSARSNQFDLLEPVTTPADLSGQQAESATEQPAEDQDIKPSENQPVDLSGTPDETQVSSEDKGEAVPGKKP